jgi:hypothetical protein
MILQVDANDVVYTPIYTGQEDEEEEEEEGQSEAIRGSLVDKESTCGPGPPMVVKKEEEGSVFGPGGRVEEDEDELLVPSPTST